jgi:hypothetical protein
MHMRLKQSGISTASSRTIYYGTVYLYSGCLDVMYIFVSLVLPVKPCFGVTSKIDMHVLFQGCLHQVLAHRTRHPSHETTQMRLSMEVHSIVAAIAIRQFLSLQHSSLPHILLSSRGIYMAMVLLGQVFPLL